MALLARLARGFVAPIPRLQLIGSVMSSSRLHSVLKESADRPFTLPPGTFRPKQSLGQNFLSDQNYVRKIVDALKDESDNGERVIELGPGPGALTRKLCERYPQMTAVEIDQRAVAFLAEKLPGVNVLHMDVLQCKWSKMASQKGGRLSIIGNLPFYITSQILFSLADSSNCINTAVVTMQYEVAERIVAKPRTKSYGILSVVFQLYGTPKLDFKIPASVFFPKPKIDAALITIDFRNPHKALSTVDGRKLRLVVNTAFGKRRKMLRQSLKELLVEENISELPDKWAVKRPEELTPGQFIELTRDIYGGKNESVTDTGTSIIGELEEIDLKQDGNVDAFSTDHIWRRKPTLVSNTNTPFDPTSGL